MTQMPQGNYGQGPIIFRYSERWNQANEKVQGMWRKKDEKEQKEHLDKVVLTDRLSLGNYKGAKPTSVLLNMFELAPANGGKKVHIAVMDKRRLHPRTGKALELKGDQHYEPQDVKMIQSAAIFKWLELIGRPAEHSNSVCGDGGELLFFNADEFTPEEVLRMSELKEPLVLQTHVDKMASAYVVSIQLAGTHIQLLPKEAQTVLELNGVHGVGLKVRTLDVLQAAILWQPGHADRRIGNAANGWQMYGNNKLMYNWAQGVMTAGNPRYNNTDHSWISSNVDKKLADCLRLMRPDPIDMFAPDARRELAKGIAVSVVSTLNNRTYLRSDLWRPIHFTGVSRMSPTEGNPQLATAASLVEEYLHRMASMTGQPYNWENLFAKRMPGADQQAEVANDQIRNRLRRLPVYTTHSRSGDRFEFGRNIKRHIIFKLAPKTCDSHRFAGQDGKEVSVTEYFSNMGIKLVHHDTLPLVDVAQGARGEVLMPMELLFIESHLTTAAQMLASKGKNDVPAEVTTSILRYAALQGAPRYVSLRAFTGAADIGIDKTSTAFGYKAMINDKCQAQALMLDCNQIEYGKGTKTESNPLKGGWMTPRGAPYLKAIPVKEEWAIALHSSLVQFWDKEIRTPFFEQMAMTAKQMGISLSACPAHRMHAYDTVDLLRTGLRDLSNAEKHGPLKLVFVIMPRRDPLVYKTVKQWGDVQQGIATQCLLYGTIKKSINRQTGRVNADTLYNLLLKMNGKMGGANWTFAEVKNNAVSKQIVAKQRDTLYLGVDVRHPSMQRCTRHPVLCMETIHSPRMCPNAALFEMSPEENVTADGSPPLQSASSVSTPKPQETPNRGPANLLEKAYSFAAISGTYTKDASVSACSLRVQAANLETLVHVKESLQERVRDYIKSSKSFPKRIVYLRDGVGETQQAQIVQEEWKALCDAVNEEMAGQPLPLMIFVLGVKQHNLRMFDEKGDKGNVRMGTCLSASSGYVSSDVNEFYLVAHKALQGTAKPLRYVVLKAGYADGKPAACGEVTEMDLIAELYPLHSMNARAQKSCSLPAPIKYAHLAAERANIHVADNWHGDDMQAAQTAINVHEKSKHAMYWL